MWVPTPLPYPVSAPPSPLKQARACLAFLAIYSVGGGWNGGFKSRLHIPSEENKMSVKFCRDRRVQHKIKLTEWQQSPQTQSQYFCFNKKKFKIPIMDTVYVHVFTYRQASAQWPYIITNMSPPPPHPSLTLSYLSWPPASFLLLGLLHLRGEYLIWRRGIIKLFCKISFALCPKLETWQESWFHVASELGLIKNHVLSNIIR